MQCMVRVCHNAPSEVEVAQLPTLSASVTLVEYLKVTYMSKNFPMQKFVCYF